MVADRRNTILRFDLRLLSNNPSGCGHICFLNWKTISLVLGDLGMLLPSPKRERENQTRCHLCHIIRPLYRLIFEHGVFPCNLTRWTSRS